jgi:hypothetical protein
MHESFRKLFCGIKKNITFATCFKKPFRVVFYRKIKQLRYEKDIPAFEAQEKEQARVP